MNREPVPQHGRACTLSEVAAALGVTRQRAQQIEQQALRKFKAGIEARGITLGDLVDDADDPDAQWPGMD